MQAQRSPGIGHNKPPQQRVQCPCCEHVFDTSKTQKPRSLEQHRRFFGLIRAAYHHWPESHEWQFADETECRKWLTMKAGYRELVLQMPMTGMKADIAAIVVGAAFKAVKAFAVAVPYKGQLVVWTPKSIAFMRMPHMEFCALNTAVEDVIKSVFGITGDELLEQHKAAA